MKIFIFTLNVDLNESLQELKNREIQFVFFNELAELKIALKENFENMFSAFVMIDADSLSKPLLKQTIIELDHSYKVVLDGKQRWSTFLLQNIGAYQVQDYLSMPVSIEDFELCLNRYHKNMQMSVFMGKYILIKDKNEHVFVHYNQIVSLEGFGSYTKVFTQDKRYIVSMSLQKFLDHLPSCFIRTHRSYAVHSLQIKSFSGNEVLLHNGHTVKGSKNGIKNMIASLSLIN